MSIPRYLASHSRHAAVFLTSRALPLLAFGRYKYRRRLTEIAFPLFPRIDGTDLALSASHEADARKATCHLIVTLYIGCDSDLGTRVIRLEGWLEGESVAELERVIDGGSGPLRLDLTELRSADPAGLDALRVLRATGASIVGAPPYIRLLLGA